MGVCILAKRVVLELSSSTNFVYSLSPGAGTPGLSLLSMDIIRFLSYNYINSLYRECQ